MRRALTDPYNERYVSVASLWEMQIKHVLGQLPLPGTVEAVARAWIEPLAAEILPIELRHVAGLYGLPPHHRDPFDRMLISQAIADGLTLVTADEVIGLYDVPVLS